MFFVIFGLDKAALLTKKKEYWFIIDTSFDRISQYTHQANEPILGVDALQLSPNDQGVLEFQISSTLLDRLVVWTYGLELLYNKVVLLWNLDY
jgi:hypothetical protein